MPKPLPVLSISMDDFHKMPHRLGWKHEYWDGKARLSPNLCAVAAFRRSTIVNNMPSTTDEDCLDVRPIESCHESELVELFLEAFDDCVIYCGYPDQAFQKEARQSVRDASRHSFGVWENNRLVGASLIQF